MEELFENFISPAWWVSVVIFGIFASIISAYLKPLLDNLIAKISTKSKLANEKKQSIFNSKVEILSKSEYELLIIKLEINRIRIRGLSFKLAGIFQVFLMFFFYSLFNYNLIPVICGIMGCLAILFGISEDGDANKKQELFIAANDKRRLMSIK